MKTYRVVEFFDGHSYKYQTQKWEKISSKFWPWQKDKWAWENIACTAFLRTPGGIMSFPIHETTTFDNKGEAIQFIEKLSGNSGSKTVYSV